MKMALLQDQLLTPAGSERMFLYLAQEFTEANLYTAAYRPEGTFPELADFDIKTTWLNRFISTHDQFKTAFPISTHVMEHLDLQSYDCVLSSSATIAKYARNFSGKSICYCYYPTRAIWTADKYFGGEHTLKSRIFYALMPYFKKRDYKAAQRINHFVAISETSKQAIRDIYDRDADVAYCPVDTHRFNKAVDCKKRGYFLIVSRLEGWKALDFAIEAFNQSGLPLKIVGEGKDKQRLSKLAASNVEFAGKLSDPELKQAYGEAKAVIFTPELEYGLVPVEAVASGTPVVAYGKGGVLETMIGIDDAAGRNPTASFFYEQTPDALNEAIEAALKQDFDTAALLKHADFYSIESFQSRMRLLTNAYMELPHGATVGLQSLPAGA